MPIETKVRPVRPADRTALEEMMAALQDYERALDGNRVPGAEMAASHLDALATWVSESPVGGILVAEVDGTVAGFIVFGAEATFGTFVPPETRLVGQISDLFVQPGHRGKGVARALLAEAERQFRAAGLRRLEVSALPTNRAALGLYSDEGFQTALITMAKPI